MKRILIGTLLVLLVMCGATACSSPAIGAAGSVPANQAAPDPGGASPPARHTASAAPLAGTACALVTPDEVSTAAGTVMTLSADGSAVGECIFSAVSDPTNTMYLEIDKSQVDIDSRKQQAQGSAEPLTGLGDNAFWKPSGEVFIEQGTRALIIDLPSLAEISKPAGANKDRLVVLARIAFGRL